MFVGRSFLVAVCWWQFVGGNFVGGSSLVEVWWQLVGGSLWVAVGWWQFVGGSLLVTVCGWQFMGGSLWVAVCWWQLVGGSWWVKVCWWQLLGGNREAGGGGLRRSGHNTKNKNPTRQCGEELQLVIGQSVSLWALQKTRV